ncbi:MAG: hypothetical protein HKN67_10680 [Saprospiraceae bacterium]|nr:hypothetical protein [Saprospiraceae bacterium]
MNFSSTMQSLADQVEGSFSEYDENIAVLIVPIDEHRFQTVYCYNEGPKGLRFISKVCEVEENMPFQDLLNESSDILYASFYIENNFLYVRGTTFLATGSEEGLKDMLVEVAQVADKWENKLTGADVH